MRILFDKNVPVGVTQFLIEHDVRTVVELQWPLQLENGELPKATEASGFDVLVTANQNIRYQTEPRQAETCHCRALIQHLADCTEP